MSDLFHEMVLDEFIDAVFAVMLLASHHTFQIITKRPERMDKYMHDIQRTGDLITAGVDEIGAFEWPGQGSPWRRWFDAGKKIVGRQRMSAAFEGVLTFPLPNVRLLNGLAWGERHAKVN